MTEYESLTRHAMLYIFLTTPFIILNHQKGILRDLSKTASYLSSNPCALPPQLLSFIPVAKSYDIPIIIVFVSIN